MKSHPPLVLAALLLLTPPASAAVGAWGEGAKAEARLIAGGVGADGNLMAGIEIVLPPGWHTYWRSPGDAGVAPELDFSASRNVGATEVDFPLPTRLDDGFAVTNVYYDRVLLPLKIAVTDPTQPVDLSVSLRLGVCAEVCVPDEVTASLTVPAGEADAAAGAELTDARKALPGPPLPGVFAFADVARDGGTDKHPVFRFTGTVPDPENALVLVEGPAGWAPYTPEYLGEDGGKATWSVKFSRLGATTPIEGAEFRLTVVSGGQAIDQTLGLP